jgi:hypothetical protein
MKVVGRLLVVGFVLAAVLVPLMVVADQLPRPLEKKLTPGVTTVSYAGQDLRFTTPVPLIVKFDALSTTQIRLTVRAYGSVSGGGAEGAAGADVNIFWENWSNDVYTGPPPTEAWDAVLDTESGFTEK